MQARINRAISTSRILWPQGPRLTYLKSSRTENHIATNDQRLFFFVESLTTIHHHHRHHHIPNTILVALQFGSKRSAPGNLLADWLDITAPSLGDAARSPRACPGFRSCTPAAKPRSLSLNLDRIQSYGSSRMVAVSRLGKLPVSSYPRDRRGAEDSSAPSGL